MVFSTMSSVADREEQGNGEYLFGLGDALLEGESQGAVGIYAGADAVGGTQQRPRKQVEAGLNCRELKGERPLCFQQEGRGG